MSFVLSSQLSRAISERIRKSNTIETRGGYIVTFLNLEAFLLFRRVAPLTFPIRIPYDCVIEYRLLRNRFAIQHDHLLNVGLAEDVNRLRFVASFFAIHYKLRSVSGVIYFFGVPKFIYLTLYRGM